ncbi:MAG: GNAT family N-acetyltransferase [Planctomycetota bacterium]
MPLELRWVGQEAADQIATIRARAYRNGPDDRDAMLRRFDVGRQNDGDICLAHLDGQPVATATALSMDMHVRGKRLPAQGVAWVGTDKTHRRSGDGAATKVMHAVLDKARERGQVVSALMPFRASFYEHFGYGTAERRHRWRVPTAILPRGDFAGMRYTTDDDRPALLDLRNREAAGGQCDCDFGEPGFDYWWAQTGNHFRFADFADDGRCRSTTLLEVHGAKAPSNLVLDQHHWEDDAALLRQLHWLATMRDQHGNVELHLPTDVRIDLLLRERQLPHRPVIHDVALCKAYTRMQIRALDHVGFCDGLATTSTATGTVTVAVAEPEGDTSTFTLDIANGHIAAKPSDATPTATLTAANWAMLASGCESATTLHRHALLEADDTAATLLDALSTGRAPFCNDYF